jgi:hypothetical protein
VLGQIDVADEAVGRLDRPDPGEPELLDQTILERRERPLGTAPGLRREGPDVLDPDPRAVTRGARPTWVGWPRSSAPASGE